MREKRKYGLIVMAVLLVGICSSCKGVEQPSENHFTLGKNTEIIAQHGGISTTLPNEWDNIQANTHEKESGAECILPKEPSKSGLSLEQALQFRKPYKLPEKGYAESRVNPYMTEEAFDHFVDLPADYTYPEDDQTLTKEQGMELAQDLFYQMKYSFADYQVSGGDPAFNKALEHLNATLPATASEEEFAERLIESIPFVKNNHFTPIDGYTMDMSFEKYSGTDFHQYFKYNYYFDPRLEFWYHEGKFILYSSCYSALGDASFRESPETNKNLGSEVIYEFKPDENPTSMIRPTFDEDLHLVYRLYCFGEKDKIPENILLTKHRMKKEGEIYRSLKQEDQRYVPDWRFSTFYEEDVESEEPEFQLINGIPYIAMRGNSIGVENPDLLKFREIGEKLKGYKYGIIDLRGNTGGYEETAYELISAYVDKDIKDLPKSYEIAEFSDAEFIEYTKAHENKNNYRIYNDQYIITNYKDEIIEKDGLIVVLIDRAIASAGEMTTDVLRHLSNTLVIGMPTSGTICSSAGEPYPLKNLDSMHAFITWDQVVWNPDYFQEFKGFEPDIWVTDLHLDQIVDYLHNLSKSST